MASIRDTLAKLLAKESPSAIQGTPLGNAYPDLAQPEQPLEAPMLSPDDLIGTGIGKAALAGGAKLAPLLMGIVKNPSMEKAAIEHFGITHSPKETGYILDNGTRLDLSGRNNAVGYTKQGDRYMPEAGQQDYLRGDRVVDHRDLGDIVGPGSGNENLSTFMDQSGAARYFPNTGISLTHTNKPSAKQIETVVKDFRMNGEPLIVDIDHTVHGGNLASKEFSNPKTSEVLNWLEKEYGKFTNK